MSRLLYDTVEEANNRLLGTIITYEGRPVQVREIQEHADGVMRVLFREFPYNGDVVRKKIDSPHFRRFVTPPLGFCNYFVKGMADVTFCERLPARRMKQGLHGESFSCSTLVSGYRHDFSRISTSEGFREMVVGEYPNVDDAMGRLVAGSSIAVDREFALRKDESSYVNLFYRRDNVGIFVRGNLYLRPDRRDLLESIIENANLPDRVEVM